MKFPTTDTSILNNDSLRHVDNDEEEKEEEQVKEAANEDLSPVRVALQRACRTLPNQAILEHFVHHNPLQKFQHLELQQAVEYLDSLDNYISPGERTNLLTGTDPRKRQKGAMADLASVFLDRGAAKWAPATIRDHGFLKFFARLEGRGFASWRSHARQVAGRVLDRLEVLTAGGQGRGNDNGSIINATNCSAATRSAANMLAEELLQENLRHFGIPPDEWESCLIAMMSKLKGWAGMFHQMETHPKEAPHNVSVSLLEFCAVQSIISRSAIEFVAAHFGSWRKEVVSLKKWLGQMPPQRPRATIKRYGSVAATSSIADEEIIEEERNVLQDQFEQKLINAISAASARNTYEDGVNDKSQPLSASSPEQSQVQFLVCIDDREGSFRRQLEQTRRKTGIHVETFGLAANFGLPICEPSSNAQQVQDPNASNQRHAYHHAGNEKAKLVALITCRLEAASFHPIESIFLLIFAPFFLLRIFLMAYAPILESWIWGWIFQKFPPSVAVASITMTTEEAAAALALTFQSSGLSKHFAPMVVVFGHGGTSVNNPYFAGYNCGACAGKKSGPNARMFATLANDTQVRAHLRTNYEIVIPNDTVFVAGEHDTTKDTAIYYDELSIPPTHHQRFKEIKLLVSVALANNALERCHRFFLADAKTPKEALRHVLRRSTDYAELRPELNHASNAGVVVGRRSLTQASFFDRRLFLSSYDPFLDNDDGVLLEDVLVPSLVVASGINLEYLFSTIAMDRYGAGTKAPLNIVGNIGMQQGANGDLRTGLPSQMVDMHVPLRCFFVVDAPPRRVKIVLKRHPDLEEMLFNNWVRLATRDPNTGLVSRYMKGIFVPFPLQEVTDRKHLTVQSEWKTYKPTRDRGLMIRRREMNVSLAASFLMILSFLIPFVLLDTSAMMNAHGTAIAACATTISLPVLAFSRRYMHGENLFVRTALLSSMLVLGFNFIAMAPRLDDLVEGWALFGLASTFLIGTYNDRVTVQSNALFALASYRFADMALLISVAFGREDAIQTGCYKPELVAGGLITAAMFKSSQFPLTTLFARSMEGPTPSSALGYAGLSAHVGLVLLSSTVDSWMPSWPARTAIASVGAITAVHAGLVSLIHADRKGALAYATSSTIGLLYCIMAAGYVPEALILALGHSSLRIGQILRAPNELLHRNSIGAMLGFTPFQEVVSDRQFELCWSLHRFDTDTNLIYAFYHFIEPLDFLRVTSPTTQTRKMLFLVIGLAAAGFPFTPLSVACDALIVDLLPKAPFLACFLMVFVYTMSLIALRFLQLNVL